jgi:hypothetical protein
MSGNVPLDEVKPALQCFVSAADYGLKELNTLGEKARRAGFFLAALEALKEIRKTAAVDAKREYETLLQKLGLGPVVDADAVGRPKDNADRIREWIWADLATLNSIVRQMDAVIGNTDISGVESNNQIAVRVLRAVATDMLDGLANLNSALYLVDRPPLLVPSGSQIPSGFKICTVCGEFRGTTKSKYLTWIKPIPPILEPIRDMLIASTHENERRRDPEGRVTASCLCEGISCRWCGVNKIHQPKSQSYNLETNCIAYRPWFSYLARCGVCRRKSETNGRNSLNPR